MKSIVLCLVMLLCVSCASGFKAETMPDANIQQYKNFYVERLPADNRGIEKLIAERLKAIGFEASSGERRMAPLEVQAIATYKDRWMWDFSMYMIRLEIEIRDARTHMLVANGETYYTSLIRKPPAFQVREILETIFLGKRPEYEYENSSSDGFGN